MKPVLKLLPLAVAASLCAPPYLHGQEGANRQKDANETASKLGAGYKAAFDNGNASALADLFSGNAHFTVSDGQVVTGRSEIKDLAEAYFKGASNPTIEIAVESARFLSEGVLLEKGVTTVSAAGSDPRSNRYSLTYVRNDGIWQIAELHEFPLSVEDPAVSALSSLDWIIGLWKVSTEGIEAETEATWTLGGKFITRNTWVAQEGADPFVSVEVIGYDPAESQIRSWTFDNEGGFGQSTWRRDENKWIVQSQATLPEGGQSSSQHIVTIVDENTIGQQTINRVLDGEALPNRDRIEIVRVIADDAASSNTTSGN
jgi:uncharacterized protein (TIGR02246 family)